MRAGRSRTTTARRLAAVGDGRGSSCVSPITNSNRHRRPHLLRRRRRRCPGSSTSSFTVRVALHMAFASLWVAVPSWQRRAGGYGSWVGISVMCVVQESLGATFTKMFQRLFGNASAGAAAMTIALVLSVDHLIWAAALVKRVDLPVLGVVEPSMAYLQVRGVLGADVPFWRVGGLWHRRDESDIRLAPCHHGIDRILQSFVFDFLFFRRSARPALGTSLVAWFDGFSATASSAADAAETGSEDALAATAWGRRTRGHVGDGTGAPRRRAPRAALPERPWTPSRWGSSSTPWPTRRTRSAPSRGVSPASRETIRCSPCSHERRRASRTARRRRRRPSISTPTTGSPRRSRPSEDFRVELNKPRPTRGTPCLRRVRAEEL